MIETKFKQTEAGLIPEDWEIKKIGQVCSIGNGRDYKHLKSGNVPVYGTGGVMCYVDKYLHDGETVCIGRKGTIDYPIYHNGKIWTVDTLFYTHSFNDILPYYLYNVFQLINWYDYNEATGVPSLSKVNILNIPIAIPKTLDEQQRIAEALSDVDALISSLGKMIEKKRNIKLATMQEHLTGKKRLPGFTEPWEEKKLGSLCSVHGRIGFRGYTKADLVKKGQGAITYSPSDIHNQILDNSNCDYISLQKYEESPEIKVFNGDILFCKTASIGKCAIVENLHELATINPQFVVLKNFNCNNQFLYYKLISSDFQDNIKCITGGSTIPTMSQEKLKEQILIMPSPEEQTAIANILMDIDNAIAKLETRKKKYEAIKQGMMQQLLTGRIRLV